MGDLIGIIRYEELGFGTSHKSWGVIFRNIDLDFISYDLDIILEFIDF